MESIDAESEGTVNPFPGLAEFSDTLIEESYESYKTVLEKAKDYFEFCNDLNLIPEKGLQKVVYDLGKKVRGPGEKNITRRNRHFLYMFRQGEELHKIGYF